MDPSATEQRPHNPKQDIFISIPEVIPNLDEVPGFTDAQRETLVRTQGLMQKYATEPFSAPPEAAQTRPLYIPRTLGLDPNDPFTKEMTGDMIDIRLMITEPLYILALDLMKKVNMSQKAFYINDPKWRAANGLVMMLGDLGNIFEGKVDWKGPYQRQRLNALQFMNRANRDDLGGLALANNVGKDSIVLEDYERFPGNRIPLANQNTSTQVGMRFERTRSDFDMDIAFYTNHWRQISDFKIIDKSQPTVRFTDEVFGIAKHHIKLLTSPSAAMPAREILSDLLDKCGSSNLSHLGMDDIDDVPRL